MSDASSWSRTQLRVLTRIIPVKQNCSQKLRKRVNGREKSIASDQENTSKDWTWCTIYDSTWAKLRFIRVLCQGTREVDIPVGVTICVTQCAICRYLFLYLYVFFSRVGPGSTKVEISDGGSRKKEEWRDRRNKTKKWYQKWREMILVNENARRYWET